MIFMLNFILSIPAILFFFHGTDLPENSFTKIVAAGSLGNLGTASPICFSTQFDDSGAFPNLVNPSATLTLSCPFGDLWAIKKFGQLSEKDNVDCE